MIKEIPKFKIIEVINATSDTKIIRLAPISGSIFQYTPGHFAFLHILDSNGNSLVKKPYSIASSPDSPYLEFCIKMVGGQVTAPLNQKVVGDLVGIEGPLGHFTFKDDHDSVFLAGGTGIAPMVGMVRYATKNKFKSKLTVFFSSKDESSILYLNEFENLKKQNPNLTVVYTLSREESKKYHFGRISKELIEKYLKSGANLNWFMCGPLEMLKSFKEYALALGADPKKLKMEGWG